MMKIREFNDCLLSKWWWRYGNKDKALWKKVDCSKYETIGGRWMPFLEDISRVSRVWGDILSVASSNPQLGHFYLSKCRVVARNGSGIRFWIDSWVGEQSLKVLFPRLYLLSVEKDDSLGMLVERKGNSEEWVLAFRRPLRAWEVAEVGRLSTMLNAVRTSLADSEHCLRWIASSSSEFNVASIYNRNEVGVLSDVSSLIWNNLSPPKSQFFGWLAWKGRVKTVDYLQSIGVLSGSVCNTCIFCNYDIDSVNLVLLLCPSIWKVWSSSVDWWGIRWVVPGSIEGLLIWWAGFKFKKFEWLIWKIYRWLYCGPSGNVEMNVFLKELNRSWKCFVI
ncbi:hypothetical protein ACSBR1_023915 [Camellia fascicularis]